MHSCYCYTDNFDHLVNNSVHYLNLRPGGQLRQRGDQQGAAPGVGCRVPMRHQVGQQAPGYLRAHRRRRHAHHGPDRGQRLEPDHPRLAVRGPGDGQPATQAGGHVVRMPLEFGGEPEQGVGRPRAGAVRGEQARIGQRPRDQDAGHDRGGRGAEAAAVRDPVHAAQPDARWLAPGDGERRPHRAHDQVFLAGSGQVRALAGNLDGQPGLADPRVHVVVQAQRQPERVEARPQVGTGRGHPHPHHVLRPAHLTPHGKVTAPTEHRCRQGDSNGASVSLTAAPPDGEPRATRPGLARWRRHRRQRRWWPGRARRTAPSPGPSGRCR